MIEYLRKVSRVVLTEEGVFHVGEVPGDYSGPQIPVEVCHVIVFTDIHGNLSTFLYNNPKVYNSQRQLVDYPLAGMEVLEAEVSEVAEAGDGYRHRLPGDVKARADKMREVLESDGSVVV